jgi:hypothetical protein
LLEAVTRKSLVKTLQAAKYLVVYAGVIGKIVEISDGAIIKWNY